MAARQTCPLDERPPPYILGHDGDELDRLIDQARFFGDLTDEVLGRAGVGPGMRVLDVGCGTGDVSVLAARRVGPTGQVLGIDRAPEAVAVAERRAREAGLTNVSFAVHDLSDLTLTGPVDALIGRLVLMYLSDPAATLRRLLEGVKPDGGSPDGLAPPGTDGADELGLTPREREVLALLADGRSNRQIGDALFISAKTASVHVSNILAKLGVANRGEAAAVAHRLHLTG